MPARRLTPRQQRETAASLIALFEARGIGGISVYAIKQEVATSLAARIVATHTHRKTTVPEPELERGHVDAVMRHLASRRHRQAVAALAPIIQSLIASQVLSITYSHGIRRGLPLYTATIRS